MDMVMDFLRRTGMAPDQVDIPLTCQQFLEEMEAGLTGKPSTLLMLPTYLTAHGPLPTDVPVAVIDAGGTNARVAKITFTKEGPQMENLTVFPIPGSRGTVTSEGFLDAFAARLLPFVQSCSSLGFCFSFPAQITPQRDGKVLYFDKEVQVSDSVGMMLLEGLHQALAQRGGPSLPGVVLNDTAAALLGGMAQTDRNAYDGFLGLIWGTGYNTCYEEPSMGASGTSMLINTESGSFSRLSPGVFDRQLDASSTNPGTHLFEKMVSGAYLGEVIRLTLAGAVEEGLLPPSFSTIGPLTTQEADAFAVNPNGDNPLARVCACSEHRVFVSQVVEQLSLRAARLVCANLIALLVRADLGRRPEQPAGIVVEGSTFYKSKLLRPALEQLMDQYATQALGRHYRFLKPENANLVGTAAAALLNSQSN